MYEIPPKKMKSTIPSGFFYEIILKWMRFMEYDYVFLLPLFHKHSCVYIKSY